MKRMVTKDWLRALILISLSLLYLYLLATPINLATADLGRFIKNGELIFSGNFEILTKNFYSYTYPDFPFVNHHWGTGALFYLFYQGLGFTGLSLIFSSISLVTFLLFFSTALSKSNFYISLLVSIILLPLLVYRNEIRPEMFSYLFMGIFLWALNKYIEDKISSTKLFLLSFTSLIWINLHIFFFFGLFLIGVFFVESLADWLVNKTPEALKKIKSLGFLGIVSLVLSFLNPAGVEGVLHPLRIYGNYGYRVLEEQSIPFLDKVIQLPVLIYFKLALGLLILSWVVWIYLLGRRYFKEKFSARGILKNILENRKITDLSLSAVFAYLGWIMLRNFTISALFFLPIIASNLKDLRPGEYTKSEFSKYLIIPAAAVLFIFLLVLSPGYWENRPSGIGLMPGVERAGEFFKENSLKGPIFNNYDIGGYLIYFLYPKEKVFVDNRPEVYPADFFTKTYIPMQEDQQIWEAKSKEYNFNSIFFYRQDLTPWAQKFLIARVKDPGWAAVFVDNYNIIFLKRNEQNMELIRKYELPKEMFKANRD